MAERFSMVTVTKNRTNPAYDGVRLGVGLVAERFGGTIRHYAPHKPDDVDEQRGLLEEAIAARPDAMMLIPAHPTALNPVIRRAREAGIVIACAVSRPDGIDPVTFVGSDNYSPAVAVAERLFATLCGKGRIAILEGHPDAPTATPRTRGFHETAARHRGIEIAASRRGDWQRDRARTVMAAILADHPALDGVLAANDFMALGALEAMEAAGRPTPVVGINAIPDAIDAIRQGRLLATASFDAMKMGCIAAEAAIRHMRGETVPGTVTIPVDLVDAGNCAQWDLPYESRELPDWDRVMDASRVS